VTGASSGHYAYADKEPLELTSDYVVVGSGAGGSAAAVILARAGYRVVVVEAGPWRDPEDYPSTMLGTMRDMMPDWGANVAIGDSVMPIVQAAVVGGGTVINSAIMVRTPADVLADWRDDHGLGDVFSERSVHAQQDAIAAELSVAATPTGRHFGVNNARLLEGLQRRGVEVHPTDRNVKDCIGSGRCMQGCRTGAKRSTQLSWLPEVIARGGAVISCAPVDRVRVQHATAEGVFGRFRHPRSRQRGATFAVRARRGVILAASATQTPLILHRSGIRPPALGAYWRAHPGAAIMGVYDEPIDLENGATQGTASIHFRGGINARGERSDGVGIKLESLALPLELIAGRVSGAGRTLVDRLAEARHQALWIAAVRAEAVGSCRPGFFGQASVKYRPTAADRAAVRAGARLLAEVHFDSGARAVRPGIYGLPFEISRDQLHLLQDDRIDNRALTWVLSHLFGGAVLGSDPQRSVVDPDLNVRGVAQLHVACASALPTTLGVNPQHTIMAVARIIAGRLANRTFTTTPSKPSTRSTT
jgi:choline dehydrogenase-like flavoprotein